MAKLRVHNIEPSTGTDVAFGTTGDTIAVSSDSLKLNTWKDSGGNTLFVSDGAGTLSSVNSSFSGAGPKLILSQTASASTSISFTADIDSTYDKYMFVWTDVNLSVDNENFMFNGSIDAGSNYNVTKTSTYFSAYNYESGGTPALSYDTSFDKAQQTIPQELVTSQGNGADESTAGILYLFAPSSTTYVKQWYTVALGYQGGNVAIVNYVAGYFNTTSAVNAIQFTPSSGNFDGKIKMYGVS